MRHRPRLLSLLALSTLLCVALLAGGSDLAADEPQPPLSAAPRNATELKQLEDRFRQVAAQVIPCTVGIRNGSSSGSGVIVSEDGIVMTAGHVVQKPHVDVTLILHDGRQVKGKTLGAFQSADAGLVKITDEGTWPFAPRGRSQGLAPGTWCVAVGHPLGYQEQRPPVLRVGRLLTVDERVLQSDCPLVGGDSGGPLFDLEGRVIGINSRIGSSMQQNFHVPVEIYEEHWERLAAAEVWETKVPTRNDDEMKGALAGLVSGAGQCVVRIACDGKNVALGTIVGPDGWVLTKASELKGRIVCRLADQRELEAKIVGIDPRFDLAMLQVDMRFEPRIDWVTSKPDVGQWVATPGPDGQPLAIGVVSVPRRAIPLVPGVLGVSFADRDDGAVIEQIVPQSPAEKAGLKVQDVIKAINGRLAANRDELIKLVRQLPPGAAVTLKVLRGEEEREVQATLGKFESPGTRQRDMQNALGVGVSRRRDNFPVVLQHDSVLNPLDCGGPLVDLSGKVIGVNIARGGRTETYCLPTDVLIVLMYDLMSGRLKPPELARAQAQAAEKAALEAQKKAEQEAQKKAEQEAQKKAEQEAQKKAEQEAQKKAEQEAQKKAEQEAQKKAEQEAQEKRQAAEAAAAEKAREEQRKTPQDALQKAAPDHNGSREPSSTPTSHEARCQPETGT